MSLKNQNVLVTDGASFIGSHLVDKLLSLEANVRVADDFSSGNLENLEYPLKKEKQVSGNQEISLCIKGV